MAKNRQISHCKGKLVFLIAPMGAFSLCYLYGSLRTPGEWGIYLCDAYHCHEQLGSLTGPLLLITHFGTSIQHSKDIGTEDSSCVERTLELFRWNKRNGMDFKANYAGSQGLNVNGLHAATGSPDSYVLTVIE